MSNLQKSSNFLPQFPLFYSLFTISRPNLDVNLFHLVKFLPPISDAVPSEINRHTDNLTNAHFSRFVKSNQANKICCLHHTSLCLASQDSPSFCVSHHKIPVKHVAPITKIHNRVSRVKIIFFLLLTNFSLLLTNN